MYLPSGDIEEGDSLNGDILLVQLEGVAMATPSMAAAMLALSATAVTDDVEHALWDTTARSSQAESQHETVG